MSVTLLATGGNVYYYTSNNDATWQDGDSASKLTGTTYGDGWFSVKKLTRPDRMELTKVVFGDGKFLVCGTWDYFVTEDGGLSWLEGVSEQPMYYAAYGDGRFITTGSGSLTQQIDSSTLSLTVLGGVVMVDDVAYWGDKFIAVKNGTEDRKLYVLTEDGIWEDDRISALPALTKAAKTLRVVNGTAYLGVNDTTVEIWHSQTGYALYEAVDGYLIDSCEVENYSYLLTSSTLYENGYPVKTAPSGRVFSCCTAGKALTSAMTRAADTDAGVVRTITNPASGSTGNSGSSNYPSGSTPPPAKKGTVTYTVVADTHNSPSGRTSATFDLGDNTLAYEKGGPDPISYPTSELRVYGNHDVEYLGYVPKPKRESDWIWKDRDNRVAAFGLNSCKGKSEYIIPLDEINALAEKLRGLGSDWDVIILTHIPLFDGGRSEFGECWKEGRPINTKELLDLLKAYHNHQSWGKYSFSGRTGYVIGCFSGHVHNGLVHTEGGIYMEAFTTNGSETMTPGQPEGTGAYNAGLYSMKNIPTNIVIDFSNKTVNDCSYVFAQKKDSCRYLSHPTDRTPANETKGILRLDARNYPKFKPDGTYLGFSKSASDGATNNAYSPNAPWDLGRNTTIYLNGSPRYTTNKIFFTGNGTLAYYYDALSSFPYGLRKMEYSGNTIHFYANGFCWNFQNGKYVFDRALSYKFSSDSSSYPAFDSAGYYIGWSGSRGSIVTNYRKDNTEDASGSATRSWKLGSGTGVHFRVNGSLKLHPVTDIVFDETGRLDHFYPEDYRNYTASGSNDGLGGTVTFTTKNGSQILRWTFKNRLFSKVETMLSSSITGNAYTCGNEWMNFTHRAYYFEFKEGYLKRYRNPDGAFTAADIDDANGWSCQQTAHYYNSLEDVCLNNHLSATRSISKLYFSQDGSKGYYVNANGLGLDYLYASVRGYIFKQEKLGLGKWLLYKVSYPNMT